MNGFCAASNKLQYRIKPFATNNEVLILQIYATGFTAVSRTQQSSSDYLGICKKFNKKYLTVRENHTQLSVTQNSFAHKNTGIHRVLKNCPKSLLSELRQISTNFDNF